MGRAGKLFDLFLEFRPYTIEDAAGESVNVVLRALRYDEQQRIVEQLGDIRYKARDRHDTKEMRESLAKELAPLARDRLVDTLVLFERPVVEASADMAPPVPKPVVVSAEPAAEAPVPATPPPDATEPSPSAAEPSDQASAADKKPGERNEAAAVVKWEAERRQQLAEITDEATLRAMVVDRQIELAVQSEVSQRLASLQLVEMVVDPETREPLLSNNPKDDNYIGKLMPATRARFIELWREFQQDISDQNLRRAARSGPFSPSGELPKPPGDSPGATIETPSPSPPTSPVSTPGVTG
jgi:hypothetical protein